MRVLKEVFGDYLCGRLKNIKIFVKKREIPEIFLNEMLAEDDILRLKFKEWINEIWEEKDKLISSTNFN